MFEINNLPLFMVLAASEWDIALTIALFVLGGLMSVIMWFFKKRMEEYDKHLAECHLRAVHMGRLEERLIGVEGHVSTISRNLQWVGNCMLMVGVKLSVKLPDPPSG